MPKIRKVPRSETTWQYHFVCPGCNAEHAFDDRWGFNGDFEKPTISPSFLQQGSLGDNKYGTCHSFIKDGMIQFLGDCTHELKGQTVPLPDNPHVTDWPFNPETDCCTCKDRSSFYRDKEDNDLCYDCDKPIDDKFPNLCNPKTR